MANPSMTALIDFTSVPYHHDPEMREGNGEGIIIGADFDQTITMYVPGAQGSLIGMVQYADSTVPTYTLSISGQCDPMTSVPASDSTVYNSGDIVYLENLYGTWTIVSVATLQDLSLVSRARMQMRTNENPSFGTVAMEFDSDNNYPGILALNYNGTGKLRIYLPAAASLAATFTRSIYYWDVIFDYLNGSTLRPIKGKIRVTPAVTLESAQT